ncbi:MAG: riboflavin synthase [Desulfovibrio sp.]|nr:riboflavin synthase [Desulfovibrio sp.]
MFTGIIQGQGEVLETNGSSERRFTLHPHFDMPNVVDGESIAVNGACLSVERHSSTEFAVYASAETLSRTTLINLRKGSMVNLERALMMGDRLGGHLVSGHVDCMATVRALHRVGQSVSCRLSFPPEYGPEVIAKGSVCLDGISLTVNVCGPDFLEVNIIPDTQKRTTMSQWRPGCPVNMETDIIGKYVRSLLCSHLPGKGQKSEGHEDARSGLSQDFLLRNGFI